MNDEYAVVFFYIHYNKSKMVVKKLNELNFPSFAFFDADGYTAVISGIQTDAEVKLYQSAS
jgi:hypothetical protein